MDFFSVKIKALEQFSNPKPDFQFVGTKPPNKKFSFDFIIVVVGPL